MAEKNQTNWSADWNPNQTNIKHVNPILTILSNCSTFSNIKSHQTIKLSSHRGIYFAVESYYKKTSGSGNYINQYPIKSKSVTLKTTVQYSIPRQTYPYHIKLYHTTSNYTIPNQPFSPHVELTIQHQTTPYQTNRFPPTWNLPYNIKLHHTKPTVFPPRGTYHTTSNYTIPNQLFSHHVALTQGKDDETTAKKVH